MLLTADDLQAASILYCMKSGYMPSSNVVDLYKNKYGVPIVQGVEHMPSSSRLTLPDTDFLSSSGSTVYNQHSHIAPRKRKRHPGIQHSQGPTLSPALQFHGKVKPATRNLKKQTPLPLSSLRGHRDGQKKTEKASALLRHAFLAQRNEETDILRPHSRPLSVKIEVIEITQPQDPPAHERNEERNILWPQNPTNGKKNDEINISRPPNPPLRKVVNILGPENLPPPPTEDNKEINISQPQNPAFSEEVIIPHGGPRGQTQTSTVAVSPQRSGNEEDDAPQKKKGCGFVGVHPYKKSSRYEAFIWNNPALACCRHVEAKRQLWLGQHFCVEAAARTSDKGQIVLRGGVQPKNKRLQMKLNYDINDYLPEYINMLRSLSTEELEDTLKEESKNLSLGCMKGLVPAAAEDLKKAIYSMIPKAEQRMITKSSESE